LWRRRHVWPSTRAGQLKSARRFSFMAGMAADLLKRSWLYM
jgi:hypothetical protein